MATTCPTSAVLNMQDSTNFVNNTTTTIANGATLTCNNQPVYLYPIGTTTANENVPCINTSYATYYTNIRNNITQTFFEGGTNVFCLSPPPSTGCAYPIGGPIPPFSGLMGWTFGLSGFNPTLSHSFTFCKTGAGSITTTSVSLQDCWTGATLAGPNTLSNATTASCFTMTLAAGTNIGTASYSISPSWASPALFNFNNGYAAVQTRALPAGTYTVTYVFTPPPSSGCAPVSNTFVFTIGPNITVTATSPSVCVGGTVAATAGGTASSYSWSPATGLSTTTGTNVVFSGTNTATYTITGTKGGCINTATTSITVNPNPTVTVNNATICSGGTATLSANGASTYTWAPGGSTANPLTVSPGGTTSYTVTGSSAGCTSSAVATVSVSPAPSLSLAATSYTICNGATQTFSASGASTYTWTPAGSLTGANTATPTSNASSSTTYTVSGSASGCAPSSPLTLTLTVNPVPTVTVNNVTMCSGGTATLTAGGASTYTWAPGGSTANPLTVSPGGTTSYTVSGSSATGCTNTAVATVSITSSPAISISSATICAGDSATLTASGASTYTWASATGLSSTSGSIVKASPSATTIYTVTGMAGSCSASPATVTVTVNASPTVTVNNATICSNGTATLTANGASTYVWAPGGSTASTLTVNPSASTQYTVTGTVGSCTAAATSTVTVASTPTLTVKNDTTVCSGSMVTLFASGATTYTWITSGPTLVATTATTMVTPTVTQTYYVGGSNSSCSAIDSVKITVNSLPTLTVSNTSPICSGQQTATLTANGANTYTWTPSSSLSSSTGATVVSNATTTTTYTLLATAANGCMGIDTTTVKVNAIPVITSNPISICIGNSGTLTATGATSYTWASSGGTGSSGASVVVTPTVVGVSTYSVLGVDANGCYGTVTTSITVNNLPTVSANTNSVCVGSTATLTANGAATYTWTPNTGLSSGNGTPVTVSPSSTISVTYTVSGTDANGCVNSNTVTLVVNPSPNISTSGSQTVCAGDTVHLSATGATNYTWLPAAGLTGANTATPYGMPTSSTNYTVIGTNALGCSKAAVVPVSTASISASFSADPQTGIAPLTVNFTNTSMGATSYTWNYGNGSTQVVNTTSSQSNYSVSGTYTVTLMASNANMCTASTSATIVVSDGFSISIPNVFTPNGDGINDNFFVKSTGVSSMSILIYDRWGLLLWQTNAASDMWDGGKQNDGTYFYVIKATDTKGQTHNYQGYLTLIK
ncbi:MAG: gliding motility-associated C-terminal domain-containing protein [Bacteroidetes bacterium]|nr:gliding motility-associated C-terminal domain-containing protein [Bacteroidota bacterium]